MLPRSMTSPMKRPLLLTLALSLGLSACARPLATQTVGIIGKGLPIRAESGGSAPGTPTTPSPASGATGVALNGTLTWTCPGATATAWATYGPNAFAPPTTFDSSLVAASKSYSGLTANTLYYWRPTCSNAFGTSSLSEAWQFTTVAGLAPGTPSGPSPADAATGISTSITLDCSASNVPTSWAILGPSTSPTLSGATNHPGLSDCTLPVTGLSNSTTYYWKATATNASGSTAGPIWSFTTLAGGAVATITVGDISYLGMLRLQSSGHCYSGGGSVGMMSMRYVAGARHIIVSQEGPPASGNTRLMPCEFLDTATYDSSGACTANCPSPTLTASPQLAFIGNWGFANGYLGDAPYDFWHGVFGTCYSDTVGGICNDAGSVAGNDCVFYGGGGCQLTGYYIVPGSPDRLFFTYGSIYGPYHFWNFGFCELNTMPVEHSVSPVSTCYGPFNSEEVGLRQVPSSSAFYAADSNYKGLRGARYFLKLADGTYAWGGDGSGASFQQGFGSAGPTIMKIDALPTTASVAGPSGPTITASTKLLAYYNMNCANPPSCTIHQMNEDGSMPGGNAIWAMRFGGYPYLWTGTPCAANADNPVGMPAGCPTGSGYVDDSNHMMIDPRQNGGIGTWGPLHTMSGCADVSLATRKGMVCFGKGSMNLTVGNVTTSAHARGWYCNGQYKGNSGFTCSGDDAPNPQGYGHPGDYKDPQYQVQCVACATGPSSNQLIPFILVFNRDDLDAVAAGSKVDYTVDAASVINPITDISSSIIFSPIGTNGFGMGWGGIMQDPNNAHIIYAVAPGADNTTTPGYPNMVIHVFKIAG